MSFKKSIVTLALTSALFACGQKTTDEYLETAESLIKDKQYNSAIIELKNAIKNDPNNSDVRFKLAQAYIQLSDLKAAEKELSAALKNDHDVNEVLTDLGYVYSLLHDNDAVFDIDPEEYDLSADAKSEISFYKGLSSFRTREFDAAKEYFADAANLNPKGKYGQLASLYNADPLQAAVPKAEALIDLDPEFFHALYFKGIVSSDVRDTSGAIDAFLRIDQLMPSYSLNYLYLANAFIQDGQYAQAAPYIDKFLKGNKDHPFANQLKAITLYNDGELELSQRHIEKAIQSGLNSNSNRLLAGMIAFEQQQFEQAHQYLAGLIDTLPPSHPATRAFFATQLELGYLEEAKSLLSDNFAGTPLHNQLAASLSYKVLQSGDVEGSKQLLNQVQSSDDTSLNTKVGLLKLSMDDMSGVDDLIKARNSDPNQIEVIQALAASYVQAGKPEQALDTIKKFQDNNPEKASGHSLEGYFLSVMQRPEEAKNAFEKALALDEQDQVALFYSARLSQQQQKFTDAQRFIDRLLTVNPNSVRGLSLNYTLAQHASSPSQKASSALNLLSEAVDRNPAKVVYKEAYVMALLASEENEKVIEVINDYKAQQAPLTEPMWLVLARASSALNGDQEVIGVFGDWAETAQSNPKAWNLYVDALVQSRNVNEAITAANKGLLLTNNNPELKIKLINILVASNQPDLAQSHLDDLAPELQQDELVQMIKARMLINKRKFTDALALLTPLYKQNPDEQTSVLTFLAHLGLGQTEKAELFAQQHVVSHPTHQQVRMLLANMLIQSNPTEAIEQYEYVVQHNDANVTALNNLSYLLKQSGDVTRAQSLIEKAITIAPSNPSVLDTAGTIYIALGQKDKAIEALEKAVKIAPQSTSYKEHLSQAKAL